MGEIQSLEEGEVTVKYLLRCSQNVYQWSEGNKQEYSTEPIKMIVGRVQPPHYGECSWTIEIPAKRHGQDYREGQKTTQSCVFWMNIELCLLFTVSVFSMFCQNYCPLRTPSLQS